jgi:hypothetical protein
MDGLAASMVKVAGAAGFGLLIKQTVQAGMKFQDLRVQLETVTGSAERASAAFKQIQNFSATTPYQVENVTKSFANLAAKGFAPTERTMRALGDMAAAFGTDITQATQAVTQAAFGEAEMLKQYGIIMRQQGDQVRLTFKGVTKELKKDSGEIFQALTELAEVNFAGGMQRQSETLSGSLSTLKDNWTILLDTIATGTGGLDGITKAVRWLTERIQEATEILANWDAAWNQLGADMTRSISKALASVNRSIARWIADMTMDLANAPWIVRAILDPSGAMQRSGAVLAMAFADTADEIERFGDELADVFEEAAQAALVIDDLGESLGDLPKPTEDAKNQLEELLEVLDRIYQKREINLKFIDEAFWEDVDLTPLKTPLQTLIAEATDNGISEGVDGAMPPATNKLREAFKAAFKDLPKFFEMLGRFFAKTIADAIISGDVEGLRSAFKQMGQDLGGAAGEAIGFMFGGPIGAMVGDLLGQIIGAKVGDVVGDAIGSALVSLGLAPDPKRVLGSFAIGPGGFSGLGGTAEAQAAGQQMLDMIEGIFDSLNAAIGGTVELTKNMEVEVKRNGEAILKIIDTATGATLWEKAFQSVQEATEAGLVELLSGAIVNMEGPLAAAFEELLGKVGELGTEGLVESFEKLATISGQISMMGDSTDRLTTTLEQGLGQFDQLRQEIESLGLSADATSGLLKDLADRERRYRKELKQNAISELAAWAKELGVNVRIQRKAAILEAKVQAKKLEIELKMLGMWEKWGGLVKQLRDLSIAAARGIGKATQEAVDLFGGTANAVDDFSDSVTRAGQNLENAAEDILTATDWIADEWERRERILEDYKDRLRGQPKFDSPFDELMAVYEEALAWVMATSNDWPAAIEELAAAFEEGWARLIGSIKDGLQDFLDELLTGDMAPGTPLEKFTEAKDAFFGPGGLVQRALSGDADALAELQGAAQSLLSMGSSMFGTSSSTFMALFNQITAAIEAALGTDYAAPDPPDVTAINAQTAVLVDSLTVVRQAVIDTSSQEQGLLLRIHNAIKANTQAILV